MENNKKIRKLFIRGGLLMILLMLFVSVSVTPCMGAVAVPSGEGGATNWYIVVRDETGNLVVSGVECSVYTDDWDDVVEDKPIDSSGAFNITGLKVSTEYYVVIGSEDHDYKTETLHQTTPASGNATLQKQVAVEDYWDWGSHGVLTSTSMGWFALLLGACACVAVGFVLFKMGVFGSTSTRKYRKKR